MGLDTPNRDRRCAMRDEQEPATIIVGVDGSESSIEAPPSRREARRCAGARVKAMAC